MSRRPTSSSVRCRVGALLLLVFILAGCERPDPLAGVTVTLAPTAVAADTPTVEPTPLPPPSAQPPQMYVFILPQTVAGDPAAAEAQGPEPNPTPTIVLPTPIPTLAFPADHLLGWAWTTGLQLDGRRLTVDGQGMVLYDRPSAEGTEVGLVLGLANVLVAGHSRCGFTPILVREVDMLAVNLPLPAVEQPQALDSVTDLAAATDRPGTSSGYAFTEELTITGQVARAGEYGISLRAEPCRAAENLGFVAPDVEMFVIGPSVGEYTPVRVDNRYLQPPINFIPPSLGRLPTRLPDDITTPPSSSP
jgi:hypothetical protein